LTSWTARPADRAECGQGVAYHQPVRIGSRRRRSGRLRLTPLFPVDALAEQPHIAGPDALKERHGQVSPVAAVFWDLDLPTIIIELAFWPYGGAPQPLSEENWDHVADRLGLEPISGTSSLLSAPKEDWRVELGPHTLISSTAAPFQTTLPRASADWELALARSRSCRIVLGAGLRVDEEHGALSTPATAASVTARYGGAIDVPELTQIHGLCVVPLSSARPYDPFRPTTFLLDTDVLIEVRNFSCRPGRTGPRATAVRDVMINLLGRDVLPGPALAQLSSPTRERRDELPAKHALAAFEHAMSLARAEVMDERRPAYPQDVQASELEVVSLPSFPLMSLAYAGVLKLRALWRPDHTLEERGENFLAYLEWMRSELQLNAAVLAQVAFSLWMSDNEAQRDAGKLLKFKAGQLTRATLGRLWGTAHDIALVAGQSEVTDVAGVNEVVILTFDQGLAALRECFEHLDTRGFGADLRAETPPSVFNARVLMEYHPRLSHLKPRVAKLIAELHADTLMRRIEGDSLVFSEFEQRVLELIEREERQLLRGGS
jgi:hypothetical protein